MSRSSLRYKRLLQKDTRTFRFDDCVPSFPKVDICFHQWIVESFNYNLDESPAGSNPPLASQYASTRFGDVDGHFQGALKGRWFERLLCLGKKVDLAQHFNPFQSISYDWKECRYDVSTPKNYMPSCRSTMPGGSAGCCTERLYGLPLLSTIIAGALKKSHWNVTHIFGYFCQNDYCWSFWSYTTNDPQNWWLEYVGIWLTWSQVSYVEVVQRCKRSMLLEGKKQWLWLMQKL